jgi:hypothetical protein
MRQQVEYPQDHILPLCPLILKSGREKKGRMDCYHHHPLHVFDILACFVLQYETSFRIKRVTVSYLSRLTAWNELDRSNHTGLDYSVSKINLKVKLSVCLIQQASGHNDVYGSESRFLHKIEAGVNLHSPAALPQGNSTGTHRIGRWVGLSACLGTVVRRRNSYLRRESNLSRPARSPSL